MHEFKSKVKATFVTPSKPGAPSDSEDAALEWVSISPTIDFNTIGQYVMYVYTTWNGGQNKRKSEGVHFTIIIADPIQITYADDDEGLRCSQKKKKNSFVVPLLGTLLGAAVLVSIAIVVWSNRRHARQKSSPFMDRYHHVPHEGRTRGSRADPRAMYL